MSVRNQGTASPGFALASALILLALCRPAGAVEISVGSDEALTYPSDLITLPDGHTTFLFSLNGSPKNFVFAASAVDVGGEGGAVVLTTADEKNFIAARGYASRVMSPPVAFGSCDPTYDREFDENYAAPGSVVPDPTRPAGNLIMLYEAENHCPGGINQHPYYATIGFARSSDNGKTWPAPVNSEFGGPDRRPVLKLATPQPSAPNNVAMGNAIPTALVQGNFLYVVYRDVPAPSDVNDGILRMARTKLDSAGNQRVDFHKWYNGAFSEPGIAGLDSPIMPAAGCLGYQAGADLSWNDYLGLYLLVFVCASDTDKVAAWYFSTATDLAQQDWAAPRLVANSQFPLTVPCQSKNSSGGLFDGWYPSFVTKGFGTGRTHTKGYAFFLKGCNGSADRAFTRRAFTITK